jgi:hypothetical protein
MNHLFIIPVLCTIIFCLAKFIEKKFSKNDHDDDEKNDKYTLKLIIRDSIIVFASSLLANFIDSQIHVHLNTLFNVITDTKSFPVAGNTEIFTDVPNF